MITNLKNQCKCTLPFIIICLTNTKFLLLFSVALMLLLPSMGNIVYKFIKQIPYLQIPCFPEESSIYERGYYG